MTKEPTVVVAPLVGTYHRVGGMAIAKCLPNGSKFRLVPEPENPFDTHALRVEVQPLASIPEVLHRELAEALAGTGVELQNLRTTDNQPGWFHLGYVANSAGAALRASGDPGNHEIAAAAGKALGEAPWPAKLGFAPNGKMQVVLEIRGG